MSKTDYLEQACLNFWLRGNPGGLASPATVYVGLLSAVANAETPSLTELTGAGGYARQAVTFGAPGAGTGTASRCSNTNTALFGPATGTDWPTAIAFGIFDSLTAGNCLYEGALQVAKTVQVGDSASFAPGTLQVEED